MKNIQRIAATDNTILITGRTGTGKSHLAREIHNLSKRREQKFLAVNLATLSENLIESELFGHERGAFSGADTKRVGKLECANGGTVFLDEIGELCLRMQTKLLEALNNFTICPVGSNREVALDIRIIAATNKDLKTMVSEGTFREDLYFRINTFEINIPDLSTQPEKIAKLAKKFCEDSSVKQNQPIFGYLGNFFEEIKHLPWTGNIRELKNAMDFAVAMSNNGWISLDLLPPASRLPSQNNTYLSTQVPFLPSNYREAKASFEKIFLTEILTRNSGRINLTAKKTGLSKVTLIDKIRRYDINIPEIKYRTHLSTQGALV